MNDFDQLLQSILKFRKDRDWKQFHNPKDQSLSLVLESTEVMEHFQWKNADEIEKYVKNHKSELGEELADVLYWVLLMSHDLDIDLIEAFNNKMIANAKKYPVEKSKGIADKYDKLK